MDSLDLNELSYQVYESVVYEEIKSYFNTLYCLWFIWKGMEPITFRFKCEHNYYFISEAVKSLNSNFFHLESSSQFRS